MAGSVDIRDAPFNAVADGITDNTEAFRRALAHAESTGETILVPEGTGEYRLTKGIRHRGLQRGARIAFRGVGAPVIRHDIAGNGRAFDLEAQRTSVRLTGNVIGGTTTLQIDDTGGVEVGDIIAVNFPLIVEHGWGYQAAEINEVAEIVDGTTLQLTHPFRFTISPTCRQTWTIQADEADREFSYPLAGKDGESRVIVTHRGRRITPSWAGRGRNLRFHLSVAAGDVVVAQLAEPAEAMIFHGDVAASFEDLTFKSSRRDSKKNYIVLSALTEPKIFGVSVVNDDYEKDWPFDFAVRLVRCLRPAFVDVYSDNHAYCFAAMQCLEPRYRNVSGTRSRHLVVTGNFTVGTHVETVRGVDNQGAMDNHPSFNTTVVDLHEETIEGVSNVRASGVKVDGWHVVLTREPNRSMNMVFAEIHWLDTGADDAVAAAIPPTRCVLKDLSFTRSAGVDVPTAISVSNPDTTLIEDVTAERMVLHYRYGPGRRLTARRCRGCIEVRHAPDGVTLTDCNLTGFVIRNGNTKDDDGRGRRQHVGPLLMQGGSIVNTDSPLIAQQREALVLFPRRFVGVTFQGPTLAEATFPMLDERPKRSAEEWVFDGCTFDGVVHWGVLATATIVNSAFVGGAVRP